MNNIQSNITAIILTFNEEIHIRRCIQKLKDIATHIIIVDCYSLDNTISIAKELGAEIIQHKWPGNQADQFNWVLKNVTITTEWILRLDADEYLSKSLIEEIKVKLPYLPSNIRGISFPRATVFMGKEKKHGIGSKVQIVRLFRNGYAHYEHRIMDEHLLVEGNIVEFNNKFYDHNLNGIDFFITKHLNYSSREAALQLDKKYKLSPSNNKLDVKLGSDVTTVRNNKNIYAHAPLFLRAFLYFIYRYILKFGFLDGLSGFLYDFFQCWWYRNVVDYKIFIAEKVCGNDKEKIGKYIKQVLKVNI